MTADAATQARSILSAALGLEVGELPPNPTLVDLPAWDSLGHVRVLLRLEAAIGRRLEAREVLAVRDLVAITNILRGS